MPAGVVAGRRTVSHRTRRAHDGARFAIAAEPGDEAAVELDLVEREGPQIAHRGIARTEIVHRDAHAERLQLGAVDGAGPDIGAFVESIELPAGSDILGPVPLPIGVRPPAGADDGAERILLRIDRARGHALAAALIEAQVRRNTHHETGPIRVQVDPPTIG